MALLVIPLPLVAQEWDGDYDDWYDRRGSRYQSQIDSLGSARVENFPIPVLYGVELDDLTRNFGDPRDGGARSHEGLDIIAPNGTPIASPTDAVVVRTGDGSGSGIYIRTANPGDEQFVYMHLSSIAPGIQQGTSVKRGEIIGFVGNTGNASGGGAHLHFEIRQNGATDPYPRLTQVFTQAEREASIRAAQARGMTLPQSALAVLNGATAPVPAPAPSTAPTPTTASELVFGETNSSVIALQKFLIAAPQGPSGTRLKNTGATGYFGPLTREALIEYQRSVGLTPNGVVDAKTYQTIFAQQGTAPSAPSTPSGASGAFTRDLDVGAVGEDVRALQVFLNTHGAVIAASGVGSPGNETTYFGLLTQKALAKYQAAQGISPAAGYFGPKTRAYIAKQ